jgi:2-haloalkanoic acid dehalogenase type II
LGNSTSLPPVRQKALRYIIFDLGNTLIYYNAPWPSSLTEACGALYDVLWTIPGFSVAKEQFTKVFSNRLLNYYDERDTGYIEFTSMFILKQTLLEFGCPPFSDAQLRPALNAMYKVSQANWLPEDEAVPTLTSLKDAGYHLAVLSNAADDQDVQFLIDKARIRTYFDWIISSAGVGIRKPSPRIFQMALDRWKARPDEVVMVGDTLNADILGARKSGIASVWITRRVDLQKEGETAREIPPDAEIASLSELPPLLECWSAG